MSHLKKLLSAGLGADALLVSSEINLRWLTGFHYSDGCAIITPNGGFVLTDFRYIEAARNEISDEFEILCPKGMKSGLCELLGAPSVRCVAIEENTLSAAQLEGLRRILPNTEFVSGGSKILDGLRRCKDEGEIEKIKAAQAITDAAFEHILGFITPDRTETEVALELEFFMRSRGAEATAFTTIAVSGSASSLPHGVPRPVKLEKGFFTMDYGARVNGYCSDMTRTVIIGRADSEMKKLYSTVLEAQTRALEAAANGERNCFMLDKLARDTIENAGYHGCFGHSLGHGVGMYVHENPRLSFAVDKSAMLEVGNVVTFEPGIYISGKYGCRIEDMAAATENGIYNFTKSPKELIEI